MKSILILLVSLALPAKAEVFKCHTRSGKTVYQSEPCAPSAKKQQVLEVEKMTPEQREEANAKLRNWQERQAEEEAVKAEADREQRLEMERQESLQLQRRSVLAQEQQARAAQRPAPVRPGIGFLPYFPYPYYPNHPHQWPRNNYPPYSPPSSPYSSPGYQGYGRFQGPYSPWGSSPLPAAAQQPNTRPEPQSPPTKSKFSAPYIPRDRPDTSILGPGR